MAPGSNSVGAKRVLVLGGYGGFGGRVARLLAQDGFAVIVAGRSLAKARAFCAAWPDLPLTPLALDRGGDVASSGAWLVVDAAGPFQGSDYGLAERCVAAGCHYLDLADARGFVAGIGALDAAAKAAGVTLLAGASSVPTLTSAVADALAAGLDRVSAIDIALSASNRASGGVSVTRAILSYVGRPVRLWRGQAWRRGFGWQEMGKVRFALPDKVLRKRVALCDVPDLDLLPARYPGRPAMRFRAGTEIEAQNLGLWLLSWLVRWGWLRSLSRLTGLGIRAQQWLGRLGGDRSAMRVDLGGWRGDEAVRRSWTVFAERGDGPWIPCMAVPLLARRLRDGGLAPGARPAAGALTLAAFEPMFARFAITSGREEVPYAPLYARVMGSDFAALPEAVRALHRVNADLGAHGRADVVCGTGPIPRLIGWIIGFPPAGRDVPVSVWMREQDGVETWVRDFGGRGFRSRLAQRGTLLTERFGPLRFGFDLRGEPDGLTMHFQRWWLGPLPMPRFLMPRGVAREYEADGRFHFDVPVSLPLVGLIVHYRGWLAPPPVEPGLTPPAAA